MTRLRLSVVELLEIKENHHAAHTTARVGKCHNPGDDGGAGHSRLPISNVHVDEAYLHETYENSQLRANPLSHEFEEGQELSGMAQPVSEVWHCLRGPGRTIGQSDVGIRLGVGNCQENWTGALHAKVLIHPAMFFFFFMTMKIIKLQVHFGQSEQEL